MKRVIYLFPVILILISLVSLANGQTVGGGSFLGSLGIVGNNQELPSNATLVNKGQVVDVNQEDHTVSVHGARGMVNVYSITDGQNLWNINKGDFVKIFFQPGTHP